MSDINIHDFNRALIAEFRATGGKMDSPSAQKLFAPFRPARAEMECTVSGGYAKNICPAAQIYFLLTALKKLTD